MDELCDECVTPHCAKCGECGGANSDSDDQNDAASAAGRAAAAAANANGGKKAAPLVTWRCFLRTMSLSGCGIRARTRCWAS